MSARWARLGGHGPFQRVFREGRSVRNEMVALFFASSPVSRDSRFAAAAGRRFGKAHERNRARRLLREAWRLTGPEPLPGLDVILLARAGMLGSGLKDVEKALADVVEKAGLVAGAEGER